VTAIRAILFVQEDQLLGSVHTESLSDMVGGDRFRDFSQAKAHLHPDCPEFCWLPLCYEECPRYRITNTGTVENSLPYFCSSLRQFFGDNYTKLEQLAVQTGRTIGLAIPPDSMSTAERTRTGAVSIAAVQGQARKDAVGTNGPCRCGSGRKFKRCCGVTALSSGDTLG